MLLIDELDRADDEFEAFLLELLSDFQVTIPEIGTIAARQRPAVIVTSNRTRELHDALKRRCLYQWIDYPQIERELEIVAARVPEATRADRRAGLPRGRACCASRSSTSGPASARRSPGRRRSLALDADELDAALFAVLKVREDVERAAPPAWLDGI